MSNPLRARVINRRSARRVGGATALLAAIALAAGCQGGSVTSTDTSSGTSSVTAASTSQDSESTATVWTEITADVAAASTGATVAEIAAANAEVTDSTTTADDAGTYDSASATTITLEGGGASASGTDAASVSVDGSTVTITGGGTYVLSGTLSDGQLVVNAPDEQVRLVLDGATVTNTDGAAVVIQDAGDAIVVLARGSTNTLADGATYADTSTDAPSAALWSSDTLTITGTGSLKVTGSFNDGISSKNGLIVTGATTITVDAADDGLRGKDYLVVESGTLNVTAGGDGLKSSEDTEVDKGFVALGGASITISAGDDGVSATTDVTVAGTTLTITAGGGTANAVAEEQGGPGQQAAEDTSASPKGVNAAVSYTQDSGTVTIDAADEGIQAVFINVGGGALNIASGDDGINASNGDLTVAGYGEVDSEADDGSVLTISGGTVQISHTYSDGIDSNGSAAVTGGLVVVNGTTGSMDGPVDTNGAATLVGITGGPSVSAGDTITVTAADGTTQTLTSALSAEAITVLGLVEGQQYVVATTSGGSTTGTAASLATDMGPGTGPDMGPGADPGAGGGPGGN